MIPVLLDYATGFETFDRSEFSTYSGSLTWDTSIYAPGGGVCALHITHDGASSNYVLGYDQVTPWIQWFTFKFRYANKPSSGHAFILGLYSGIAGAIALNSSGKLDVYGHGASPSVVITGNQVLDADTWYTVSFNIPVASAATEYCMIVIDGEIDSSAQVSGGSIANNSVMIGDDGSRGTPAACDYWVDDVFVSKTQFLPFAAYRIEKLVPASDGTYDDWTSGSNAWDLLDDYPNDGDTTKITSTTTNSGQTVKMQTMEEAGVSLATGERILGVIFSFMCGANGSSTARAYLKAFVDSTEYTSGLINFGSSSSFTGRSVVWGTDPNTGEDWTEDKVDSLELGFYVGVSGYQGFKCTQVAAHLIIGHLNTYTPIMNISGVETGDTSEFDNITASGVSVDGGVAHSGDYSLATSTTGSGTCSASLYMIDQRCRPIDPAHVVDNSQWGFRTTYVNFYFYADSYPSSASEQFFRNYNNGTSHVVLRLTSGGNIAVYNNTTLLGTGSSTLSTGTWYNIGVRETTAASGSTAFEVQLDGATEVSGTGSFANDFIHVFSFGKSENRNSGDVSYHFDDIVIRTDGFQPLPYGMGVVVPDGDGTDNDWTPSGASTSWEATDERGNDGDTSYTAPTYPGSSYQRQRFEMAPLTENPNVVPGVKAIKIHVLGKALSGSEENAIAAYVMNPMGTGYVFIWSSVEYLGSAYDVDACREMILGEDIGASWTPWTRSRVDQIEVGALAPLTVSSSFRITAVSITVLGGVPLDPIPMIAYNLGG